MSANKRFERREIKIVGDVACIPLGGLRGKDRYALIDIRDVHLAADLQWRVEKNGYVIADIYPPGSGNGRMKRSIRRTLGHRRIYLHHMILGKPSAGFVVDHVSRNRLDNRRSNIRFATYRENVLNRSNSFEASLWKA